MTSTIVFLDKATIPSHIRFNTPEVEHEWKEYDLTSPERIIPRCKEADVIIVNKVVLEEEVIAQLPRLKHIAVIATGYNNIDIEACKSRGIAVTNTPGYSVTSVPEHTLALIFALRRHLFAYQHSMKRGDWQKSPYFHGYLTQTLDLKNSQLGIIGGGSLGQATATLAKALGMRVVFAERKGKTKVQRPDYLPFDEFIQSSDIISLHCPLTPETENLIALDEFKKMKPSALLINTARGGLVDEQDLVTALKGGLIAGAGFDVASAEPIQENNPLLTLLDEPNFILTPHVAWSSDDSLQCQADMLIDNVNHFFKGSELHRVV